MFDKVLNTPVGICYLHSKKVVKPAVSGNITYKKNIEICHFLLCPIPLLSVTVQGRRKFFMMCVCGCVCGGGQGKVLSKNVGHLGLLTTKKFKITLAKIP